jgi:hypothetical protein
MRGNDALKWKDIKLYMVKHPEDPKRQVLLMRVKHRLNKGNRNKGVRKRKHFAYLQYILIRNKPVFTYTERNDNLGLCVIQDVLEYAFLDNAFASEHIKCPRDIWCLTNVPGHRLSTPIHFKEEVKHVPIFRFAVKNNEGCWVTDPLRAFTYNQVQAYEKSASVSAAFREQGSLYKYRKGTAANLNMYAFSLHMNNCR